MQLRKKFFVAFGVLFLTLTLVIGGLTWYVVSAAMQASRRVIGRTVEAPMLLGDLVWVVIAILVATLVCIGGFIVLSRRMMRGDDKLLRTGLPGTAQVLAVRDTGTTINRINAVIEVRLRVSLPGRPDYDAVVETILGRMNFGAIRPGMIVRVRVDAADPARVAIDLASPAGAQAFAGAPGGQGLGTVMAAGGAFNLPGVVGNFRADAVRSAADMVATGQRAEAVIHSISHSGATAGQMVPDAARDPAIANDPMIYLSLQVEPPGGAPYAAQGIHRVPQDMLGKLAIGKRIPVAFIAGNPASVSVDWKRLR